MLTTLEFPFDYAVTDSHLILKEISIKENRRRLE